MRTMKSGRFRWVSAVTLGCLLAAWPAAAWGQVGVPLPPLTAPPQAVPQSLGSFQELFERRK